MIATLMPMLISNHKSSGSARAGSLADCIAWVDAASLELLVGSELVVADTAIDSDTAIATVLLAIGSNEQADYHLAQAREQLAKLGKMIVSEPLVNPDFTAMPDAPKPDYTNQCVYIDLNKALSFLELSEYFTAIETLCERQRVLDTGSLAEGALHKNSAANANTATALANASIKVVSMDIDILGFSQQVDGEWRLIQRRLPLKEHEKIGLQELLTSPSLLPITSSSLASAPLDSLKN